MLPASLLALPFRSCHAAASLRCCYPAALPLSHYLQVSLPVLAGNMVPKVKECSERAEQCSEHPWACSGHVAKISRLRLNIGSGKLSSCMLSIGLGPKCEQGKGGQPPPLP